MVSSTWPSCVAIIDCTVAEDMNSRQLSRRICSIGTIQSCSTSLKFDVHIYDPRRDWAPNRLFQRSVFSIKSSPNVSKLWQPSLWVSKIIQFKSESDTFITAFCRKMRSGFWCPGAAIQSLRGNQDESIRNAVFCRIWTAQPQTGQVENYLSNTGVLGLWTSTRNHRLSVSRCGKAEIFTTGMNFRGMVTLRGLSNWSWWEWRGPNLSQIYHLHIPASLSDGFTNRQSQNWY